MACRRGDRQALERVLRAEIPALERLLARLVYNSADVEDLLQITLIKAIHAFPRFRGEASVTPWLAQIAVNVFRDYLRRPEMKRQVALELVPESLVERQVPTVQEVLGQRECLARLYEHLCRLPAKKRVAFVLHVLEGHAVEEVAEMMNASKAATKSRVFWARRELLKRARRDSDLHEFLTGREPL